MDPIQPSPSQDPEFGSYENRLQGTNLGENPGFYLRLVANPFLATVFMVIWLGVLYQTVVAGFAGPLTPMVVLMLLSSLLLLPYLLQYHCLDCGMTGFLLRWRKHTCERAVARLLAGTPRRFRGPSPVVQVLLWAGLMLVILAISVLH